MNLCSTAIFGSSKATPALLAASANAPSHSCGACWACDRRHRARCSREKNSRQTRSTWEFRARNSARPPPYFPLAVTMQNARSSTMGSTGVPPAFPPGGPPKCESSPFGDSYTLRRRLGGTPIGVNLATLLVTKLRDRVKTLRRSRCRRPRVGRASRPPRRASSPDANSSPHVGPPAPEIIEAGKMPAGAGGTPALPGARRRFAPSFHTVSPFHHEGRVLS